MRESSDRERDWLTVDHMGHDRSGPETNKYRGNICSAQSLNLPSYLFRSLDWAALSIRQLDLFMMYIEPFVTILPTDNWVSTWVPSTTRTFQDISSGKPTLHESISRPRMPSSALTFGP